MNRLAPLMAIHAEKQSTFVSRLRYWALLLLTVGLLQATTVQAQTINTIAGDGTTDYVDGDENATATAVSLSSPRKAAAAISATGDLYIADSSHNRIRRVDKNGIITTVAGNGTVGSSGDGGPATSASLNYPTGIAIDSKNNLYIADNQNHRIRKVTGTSPFTITTVAGTGDAGYNGDNIAATTAQLNTPVSVVIDSSGTTLYIVDKNNQRIRKVIIGGNITTVAGTGEAGYNSDGIEATKASLNFPFDVAVDTSGNLFIADTSNQLIRKVTGGIISTVAGNGAKTFTGDGGAATDASLNNPAGIAVDASANLYIADTSNQRIRQVRGNDGIINTVVGNGTKAFGGDGGAPINASLNNPYGIMVDAKGNLYIADTSNQRVRKVTPLLSATATSLTSTPNPITYHDGTVTFTATVTGDNPLGSVAFLADGTSVAADCEAVFLDNATSNAKEATCKTYSLSVGSHSITAVYSGDNSTASSTSPALTQTVNKAITTTTVTSNKNPSTYGDSVTFSAMVRGSASPSGTVTFKNGSATITGCSAVDLSTEAMPFAYCETSALNAGANNITGTYNSDSNNASSTSVVALVQTVNKKTPTTTVTSSKNPSTSGESVTFTASVSGNFPPTGTVIFKDGNTTLCNLVNLDSTTNPSKAMCKTSTLTIGNHNITAVYGGDNNNVSNTSAILTQSVKTTTSTKLTSTASVMAYGNPVYFTATIKGTSPTGTVVFKDNGQLVPVTCTSVTVQSNGQATCNFSTLYPGSHSITATYNGDGNNFPSTSNAVILTVNQTGVSTSTTISSSVNPSVYGNPVTFTATIKGRSPTGTVRFVDGSTIIPGCEAVYLGYSGSGGSSKTTCKTSNLSVGSHSIKGVYSGDADDGLSISAIYTMQVNGLASSTSLSSSLNPSTYGQEVTLTAKVKGSSNLTGTITFKDSSTIVCGPVTLSNAQASCKTKTINAGSRSIVAVYSGDAYNASSTSPAYKQNVITTIQVSLTSPEDGDEFPANSKIGLSAEASDTYAPIAKVEFYADTLRVGTDTTSPYYVLSSNMVSGSYIVKAKVTDTAGQSWISDAVTITVCNNSTCLEDYDY